MRNCSHTVLAFLLCLFSSAFIKGQYVKGSGNGTTISLGPVVNFYTLNTKHAVDPRGRMSFIAGIRREIKVDNQFRTFIQFGAEYFIHGLSYGSYYFDQDTLQLYDKNFDHEYAIFFHEINMPVQLKILFNRGNNNLHSPYASVTYHLRYMMPAHLQVRQYGNQVKKDFPEMTFRNPLIHKSVNAFVSVGLGWQRNKISARGSAFFAELNFRYGFSDYHFRTHYSASSVYINGTHLALLLGLKL